MVDFVDLCEYPTEALAKGNKEFALDTETLGATKATNIPIYFSYAARDFNSGAGPTTTQEGYNFLSALCESNRPKIFHNAKFDISVLKRAGLEVKGEIHDTILMHMLLDEHHLEAHRLKSLSRELLGRARMDAIELRRAQKKFKLKLNTQLPQLKLHVYALPDAVDTLDLFYLFKPQLEEQGLWDLYRDEVAAELVYMRIEENGVALNTEAALQTIDKINVTLNELIGKVHEAFGEKFLISSPAQLGNVLAKHFPLRQKTPSGSYSTAKDVLTKYITDPRMQLIFACKFLAKARGTVAGYARRVTDGRLHPNYRQTTTSGRCACKDPNLTTIPKQRGRITAVEVGSAKLAEFCADAFRMVRKAIIAPPGARLVSYDYEQIEYRGFAYYTGSERILQKLREGEDFHTIVCQMVFEEVTKRLRHIIKIVNYGLLYGMGKNLLYSMLREQGIKTEGLLEKYEAMIPEMRDTQHAITSKGRRQGYVTGAFGRRYRYLKESPHALVAWLCQGFAANMKKQSLIRVQKIWDDAGLTRYPCTQRSVIVLDIHDEIVNEVYPEDRHLLSLVRSEMERFPQFGIPFPVSGSMGANLLDMKDMDETEMVQELERIDYVKNEYGNT